MTLERKERWQAMATRREPEGGNPRASGERRQADNGRLRFLVVSLDSRLGGGMPALAHGLVTEVARRGVEIRLLESRLGLPADAEPQLARDGLCYLIGSPGAVLHDCRDVLRDCGDLFAERAFEAVLDEWDPNIVFFVHTAGLGMSLVHLAKRRGLQTIVYVADYYLLCPLVKLFHRAMGPCLDPLAGLGCSRCTTGKGDLAPLYNFRLNFARDTLRRVATVVNAQSEAVKRILLRFDVPEEKIRVLWPGINGGPVRGRRPRQPGEPVAFGFVGNAGFAKGCHVMLDAFLRLAPERATLTFYGGGEPGYVAQLRERGADRVRFTKPFHPAELPGIMQEIDVGIVPSLWEECGPLVVSEFLHHRVPVIGSRIGAIPEQMVDGEDGLLVAAGSVEELFRAMKRFLDEPAMLACLPAGGRKVKTMGEWAEEVIELGLDLVTGHRAASPARSAPKKGKETNETLGDPGDVLLLSEKSAGESESGRAGSSQVALLEELKRRGDFRECVREASVLLAENSLSLPERVRIHRLAGECLGRCGDLLGAREHFEKGLCLDPEATDIMIDLGALDLAAGEGERALEVFSRLAASLPQDDRVLAGLGLSLVQCGRPEEALSHLEGALGRNPENLMALCALTPLAYQQGRIGELERHLRAYLEHHPGSTDILYSLAGCLFKQGRLAEARVEIEKILLLCPAHDLAHELLVRIEGGNLDETQQRPGSGADAL